MEPRWPSCSTFTLIKWRELNPTKMFTNNVFLLIVWVFSSTKQCSHFCLPEICFQLFAKWPSLNCVYRTVLFLQLRAACNNQMQITGKKNTCFTSGPQLHIFAWKSILLSRFLLARSSVLLVQDWWETCVPVTSFPLLSGQKTFRKVAGLICLFETMWQMGEERSDK